MSTPRVGIVGAGFHATRNILPALRLAGIEPRGLATRSRERSAAALASAGWPDATPYAGMTELLDDEAVRDVIIIAQPADMLALTLQAVAAGRNVFADKPLGWTESDAVQLADAADARGVRVEVGFMKRHAPAYTQLHELIRGGELGDVRSFGLTFGCDSGGFCADEEDYVKLAAIHVIDLVRALFGEVDDVSTISASRDRAISLIVSLRFTSGVIGSLELSGLPSFTSETERLRVVGDRGTADVTDVSRLAVTMVDPAVEPSWGALSERTSVWASSESAMSGIDRDLRLRGFVGELEAFVAGPDAQREMPIADARDNVATMRLCAAILAR